MATDRRDEALKAETGAFLDAFIVFRTGREFEFVLRFIDKLGGQALRLKGAGDIAGLIERAGFRQLLLFTFEATLAGEDFRPFAEKMAQVTTDARIRPIITTLTTISA